MTKTLVIVCGSRALRWTVWYARVRNALSELPPDAIVLHGNERGADRIADAAAEELGLATLHAVALWDRHGHRAGPRRNDAMAAVGVAFKDAGASVRVLAFHDDPALGKGTADMVRKAEANGLRVTRIVRPREEN